jgi:subtilase family serine protease
MFNRQPLPTNYFSKGDSRRKRVCLQVEELESRALPSTIVGPDIEAQPLLAEASPAITNLGQAYISPNAIKSIYGFIPDPTAGQGITIAIVDAFKEPNVASDLSTFNTYFGLPQFNQSGGPTFKVVNQTGGNKLPSTPPLSEAGWRLETALDVEWAHAIAPGANILLVEARSANFTDLFTAVNYAAAHAQVVSMSWGSAGDISDPSPYDPSFQVNNVTFVASAGDTAGETGYPATSPYVVSVGGTNLTYTTVNGTIYATETAWSTAPDGSGGGGGLSISENQPNYQSGLPYTKRAVPDVAYDADPNTGFAVYNTYYGGAVQVGGTSAGAPQWAALFAIVDQQRGGPTQSLTSVNTLKALYDASIVPRTDFFDIIQGSAGAFNAGPGYDLVTGLGSPNAAFQLIQHLVAAPNPNNPQPFALLAAAPTKKGTPGGPRATISPADLVRAFTRPEELFLPAAQISLLRAGDSMLPDCPKVRESLTGNWRFALLSGFEGAGPEETPPISSIVGREGLGYEELAAALDGIFDR